MEIMESLIIAACGTLLVWTIYMLASEAKPTGNYPKKPVIIGKVAEKPEILEAEEPVIEEYKNIKEEEYTHR